jgi:hypothetical protein
MGAVGEQVNVGVAANDFGEAFAELALEVTHDLADSLQGKTFAAQLADDGDFGKVLDGIKTAVALTLGLDDSTLVPPLELAGGDAG